MQEGISNNRYTEVRGERLDLGTINIDLAQDGIKGLLKLGAAIGIIGEIKNTVSRITRQDAFNSNSANFVRGISLGLMAVGWLGTRFYGNRNNLIQDEFILPLEDGVPNIFGELAKKIEHDIALDKKVPYSQKVFLETYRRVEEKRNK